MCQGPLGAPGASQEALTCSAELEGRRNCQLGMAAYRLRPGVWLREVTGHYVLRGEAVMRNMRHVLGVDWSLCA